MTSWSERLYQSLTLHLRSPRQQSSNGRRHTRRLFSRILRPASSGTGTSSNDAIRGRFGFESPPPAASRISPICQAVLVAWAGPAGHLSPAGLRAAVVANFVLQVNRAFGHSADAVASVPSKAPGVPAVSVYASAGASGAASIQESRRQQLLRDLSLIGLHAFRFESEDCYARETHRLVKVLSHISLPGSERWCDRRLRDLLAALARVERASCHRLHFVAGRDEARRLAELGSGLQALGYPGLAAPVPWRLHVDVGPVSLASGASAAGYRRRGRPSPEELLSLAGSRDYLLLQLLSSPRSGPVEIQHLAMSGGRNAQLADTLQRCRLWLSSSGEHRVNTALVLDDADVWMEGSGHDFCSRLESTLAQHLGDFPDAAAAAYLSYEPRHLVAHLGWLVRLLEAAACLLEDEDNCGMSARARQRLSVGMAAGVQVMESACGVLGLAAAS